MSSPDLLDFPDGTGVKNPPANVRDTGLIAGLGRFPGEETHPSILAWKGPQTEEPRQATVHGVTEELDTT